MSRARFIQRSTERAHREFTACLADGYVAEAERDSWVADFVAEELAEAEREAAEERELFGQPEDTPCLQSADLWGTGEGQYHGVIG